MPSHCMIYNNYTYIFNIDISAYHVRQETTLLHFSMHEESKVNNIDIPRSDAVFMTHLEVKTYILLFYFVLYSFLKLSKLYYNPQHGKV